MPVFEILPDFFFVQRGYLNGNHFAWRGARPVLIDTAYLPHVETTIGILAGIGVEASRTALILTTHSHCDHIGGHRRIQALSGCGIALHPIGRHFIEARDAWSTWWRYYDQPAEFFECTRSLQDGELVDVGPYRFTVLHTPGHSADGLVLYCAEDRLLLSSDALWEKDVPVMTIRVEGSRTLFDALGSLERIRALDVRRVYPGHGPGFEDMPAAVAGSAQRLRRYLQHPEDLGNDQLKRIIVYTLLMHPGIAADGFFDRLMGTVWFPESCCFFFGGDFRRKYDETVSGLLERGILTATDGSLTTVVPP
jgi:glyoxylase-like metal-dependent hydrolase (beta-lactamase superfamily II)